MEQKGREAVGVRGLEKPVSLYIIFICILYIEQIFTDKMEPQNCFPALPLQNVRGRRQGPGLGGQLSTWVSAKGNSWGLWLQCSPRAHS